MREYFMCTQRLGFSVWTVSDIELAESLWGEPDVTRFICASGVFTQREIVDRLYTEVGNYEKYRIQYYPIFELNSGELVGCCGLRPCEERNVFELGCHMRKKFWKQGFAREAADAVIRYAFSAVGAKALRAGHHPSNEASRRLLSKLGFRYESEQYYAPTGLYHPSYFLKNENQ